MGNMESRSDPATASGGGPRLTRRRFLQVLGALGAVGGVSYLALRGLTSGPREPTSRAQEAPLPELGGAYDDFVRNIANGGPPKDGIPPIDEPRFLPASEATFLDDRDVVFGIVHAGEVRSYPQLVLVWHEIVNDRFPDGRLSITYCPLTGSVVGFRGTAPSDEPYTFGTSGDLVNSNLLMYDRQTDNRWPQILGQSILTPQGRSLEEIPLEWTTWGRWRALHPDTVVLSTDTGYIRNYGADPYGSYDPLGGYYREGSPRFFSVMREDPRFDDKEVVVGVKLGRDLRDPRLAVRKDLLRRERVVSARMGAEPVVLLYDPTLDAGRGYRARTGDRTLRLSPGDAPGEYVDAATGSVFDALGRALRGSFAGAELPRLVSYDVMWFAWVAFFPRTDVIG